MIVKTEFDALVRNAVCDELMAETSDGVMVYDRQMRYIMWNPAMERISGFAASDVIGKHCLDVSLMAVDPKLAASLGRTISARRKIIGLWQEELAHRVGLHRTYISNAERGSRSISIGTLEKFSAALPMRAWVLLRVAESHLLDPNLLKLL